jgi:hypothetical protein
MILFSVIPTKPSPPNQARSQTTHKHKHPPYKQKAIKSEGGRHREITLIKQIYA